MQRPKNAFGRFLSEVIASEIPIQFVSAVPVIFKNGKKSRLTREELALPLPLEKNLNWNKVSEGFANVANVEIHIDLESLEQKVSTKTDSLFEKYFEDDN